MLYLVRILLLIIKLITFFNELPKDVFKNVLSYLYCDKPIEEMITDKIVNLKKQLNEIYKRRYQDDLDYYEFVNSIDGIKNNIDNIKNKYIDKFCNLDFKVMMRCRSEITNVYSHEFYQTC